MRNGLNISGVSELVHEIQEKPEEALITFDVSSRMQGPAVDVDVHTAHHGTFRMARGFQLRLEAPGAPSPEAYSSPETTVAALGACVLITHVNGYTARGVNLGGLNMTVTANLPVTPDGTPLPDAGFEDIRYAIDVACEANDDMVRSLTQFTTCFSPNHRAFLDEAEVELRGTVLRSSGAVDTLVLATDNLVFDSPTGQPVVSVEARVRWEYGTEVWALVKVGGEAPAQRPPLIIDQSKQMLGIDRGPNPQETLLAAICGDLTAAIREIARDEDLRVGDVRVDSRGQLDIRGMANVQRDVSPRFHGLRFEVELTSDEALTDLRQVLVAAARNSPALCSLRRPNTIDVRLSHGGEQILELESSREQAEALRDAITEQQRRAMASEAS